MSTPKREKFTQKLLLEGKDDLFVTAEICEKAGIKHTFDLIDCDGVDNIPGFLEQYCVQKRRPDVSTLGVVLDADAFLKERWQSIKTQFERMGYNIPQSPDSQGTIIEGQGRNPRIGIWIMPNNTHSGMLEDFVKFLVPENDELLSEVNKTLDSIEGKRLNNYTLLHRSKAQIHTWLAWQEDPGVPMGLAIKKKYLTTNSKECQEFIQWLEKLFNE